MEFIAYYKDPKKKKLQWVEILLLFVIAPLAVVWGTRTYGMWVKWKEAERIFVQGDAHLHAGELEEAVKCFERCIELHPEFYGAWEGVGSTHHLLGNHDQEFDAYSKAVALLPHKGELHRELSTAYHERGDHKSELECLKRAKELLGHQEIFTQRLIDRAQREVDGTYPTKQANAAPPAPEAQLTPVSNQPTP